jgi:hypothetical protein
LFLYIRINFDNFPTCSNLKARGRNKEVCAIANRVKCGAVCNINFGIRGDSGEASVDTKAKCHFKKLTCKGTLLQVFICVYVYIYMEGSEGGQGEMNLRDG